MPVRRATRRPRRKMRKVPRRKMQRGIKRQVNIATITETRSLGVFTPGDYNQDFGLYQFPRALALSQSFKYFRPRSVEWVYNNEYNTYQDGDTGVTPTIPYVWKIMNRTGDQTVWSAAQYEQMGVVKAKFTKPLVIKYKPNLVQSVQVQPTGSIPVTGYPPAAAAKFFSVGSRPLFNQWIATTIHSIDTQLNDINPDLLYQNSPYPNFHGHSVRFDQVVTGVSERLGTLECRVVWEFKDPLPGVAPTTSAESASEPPSESAP